MKNTNLSPFFDKISKKYAKKPEGIEDLIREKSFEEISRIIRDYQKKGKIIHILEAGCGNGALTLQLLRFPNARITSVDFSQGMLNELRKSIRHEKLSFKHITLVKDDIRTARLKKEGFDIVILVNVLINFKNLEDVKKAITNLSKAVKPKGLFILSIINKKSFTGFSLLISQCLERKINLLYVPFKAHTVRSMNRLLVSEGFIIKKMVAIKSRKNPFNLNLNAINVKNKILKMSTNRNLFWGTVLYVVRYMLINIDILLKIDSAYLIIAEK